MLLFCLLLHNMGSIFCLLHSIPLWLNKLWREICYYNWSMGISPILICFSISNFCFFNFFFILPYFLFLIFVSCSWILYTKPNFRLIFPISTKTDLCVSLGVALYVCMCDMNNSEIRPTKANPDFHRFKRLQRCSKIENWNMKNVSVSVSMQSPFPNHAHQTASDTHPSD
jgi:hypothetical protein